MTTSRGRGTLYLVPNGLDVGTAGAEADLGERLPIGTLRVAARLGDWVCAMRRDAASSSRIRAARASASVGR